MAAKRCSTCALNWPTTYRQCYGCGGMVDYISNCDSMDEADAGRLKATYEFEHWLLTPNGKACAAAAARANDRREAELAALDASLTSGEIA